MSVGNPLVSVTVSVRNGAHWIDDCMVSLCAQTHRPLEIIAVDDGSTDGGAELLQQWHDPLAERQESNGIPVRVMLQEPLGLSAGRNNALNEAEGEWVAITDIDCRPEPDWIERMVAESDSEAGLEVFGITGRTIFQVGDTVASKTRARIIEAKYREKRRFTSLANGPCSMFERRALLAIGGFDPAWYHAEDMEVSCRLTEAGGYIIHTPDAVVHHVAELESRLFLAKRRRDARAHVRIIRNFGWRGPRRPDGELVPFDFTSDANRTAIYSLVVLLGLATFAWLSANQINLAGRSGFDIAIIGLISLFVMILIVPTVRLRAMWSVALWLGFIEGWLDALLARNGQRRLFTKRVR